MDLVCPIFIAATISVVVGRIQQPVKRPTWCHGCAVTKGSTTDSDCILMRELCSKTPEFAYCYTSWIRDEDFDDGYIVRNGCMSGTDVLNHMNKFDDWPITSCQQLEMGEKLCVCRNGNFCNKQFITELKVDKSPDRIATESSISSTQAEPQTTQIEPITQAEVQIKQSLEDLEERFGYDVDISTSTDYTETKIDVNVTLSLHYYWIPLVSKTTTVDSQDSSEYQDTTETSDVIVVTVNNVAPLKQFQLIYSIFVFVIMIM